jgi:GTP pyrophosphokinase
LLLLLLQLHGRTKSLFSAMRKILRLGDMAGGGRRLEQLHDLLGLRAIVQPRADLPGAQARLAAIEVIGLLLLPASY